MQTEDAFPADTSLTESEEAEAEAEVDHRVAGTHFDTSEVELLISAAFLFSLTQAPSLLRRGMEYFAIHFPDDEVYRLIFTYLLMATVGLILGFSIHLCLRGFWIGLLGLHSVYPEPLDYDELKHGPLYTRHIREKWPTVPQMIESVDKMASLTFSFAMCFVLIGVYMAGGFTLLGILWFIIERQFPELSPSLPSPFALIVTPLAFHLLLIFIDKRFRGKPVEDTPRWLRAVSRLYPFLDRLFLTGINGPVTSIFKVRLKGTRFGLVMVTFITGTLMMMLGLILGGRDMMSGGSYDFFAEQSATTQQQKYYLDQRGDRGFTNPKPTIPSDVIEGPYLKLFLPYSPRLDRALNEKCPTVAASLRSAEPELGEEAAEQAIQCLLDRYRVFLNDQELTEPDAVFSRDDERGRRGLRIYIPGRRLQEGRNRLRIEEVDHPLGDHDRPEIHHIPFWR